MTTHLSTVSPADYAKAIESRKFTNSQKVDPSAVELITTQVRDVKMFGPEVGFVVSESEYRNLTARTPEARAAVNKGYKVTRGESAGVLVVVNGATRKFLGTRQLKFGVGRVVPELLAGMANADGDMKGVAFRELYEESGILVTMAALKPLGSFYASQGLLDEEIHLYYVEVTMTEEEMAEKLARVHGLASENEHISLFAIDEKDLPAALVEMKDAKFEIAYHRWKTL